MADAFADITTDMKAIDDIRPAATLRPTSSPELEAMLKDESKPGIVVTCNGSKLDFGGTPTRYERQLDLSAMPRQIAHSPGDLVVRVSSNTPLRELQGVLEASGQRLSLDEVVPNSSIGGVVSSALSGPLRHRFGGVRDLLLGCSFVRADGKAAKAGGIVVKNVAGYDLAKLLCGSYGTLVVLTECIFRLHPLPKSRHFLSARLSLAEAVRSVEAIASSTLDATAIEVNDVGREDVELAVLIEGSTLGAERRAGAARALIRGDVEIGENAPTWWGALPDATVLKIAFEPSSAPEVLRSTRQVIGASATVRGSIGLGLVTAGVASVLPAAELQAALAELRPHAARAGGSVQVLRARAEQKRGTDLFGPVAGLDLMARIKDQFDPEYRLGAGRFVGGW